MLPTTQTDDAAIAANPLGPMRMNRYVSAIILTLFAAILLRDIREPWTGLHDWNGAFYSQLARNLLRYPFDMHHGMPIVAVGDALPGDGEWSFYPTHPPGLVWCIAASFQLFGEHEWAARLVPILASLGTLVLLMKAARERYGNAVALLTGAIYALLPMAGYFGRMPDQEAPCLFLMLAAVMAADRHLIQSSTTVSPIRAGFIWAVCIFAAVWMDWVAIILAALVCLRAVHERFRGRITTQLCIRIFAPPTVAIILLFVYLIHFGFAGRAADLFAVFSARAGVTLGTNGPSLHALTPWTNTVDNLTLPIIALAVIGFAFSWRRNSGNSFEKPIRSSSPTGLTVLSITGIIWIALFWRQYLVHQYWLYYLGPAVAIFAARAVVSIHRAIALRVPAAGWVISSALTMTTVTASHYTMLDLHKRVHCPMSDIDAWNSARERIAIDLKYELRMRVQPPPVLLVRNPIQFETRGSYSFRNIVPPQFAYYFDLPFRVEPDLNEVTRLLPDCSGLLMPTRFAVDHAGEIASRLSNVEHHSLGTWELFKYRR